MRYLLWRSAQFTRRIGYGHDPTRAGCAASGGIEVTAKTEKPEKPEPAPATEAQSFGEALAEMGFLPVNPPQRIVIRSGRAGRPLRLGRLRKEQT
jgi:hypothetical protein